MNLQEYLKARIKEAAEAVNSIYTDGTKRQYYQGYHDALQLVEEELEYIEDFGLCSMCEALTDKYTENEIYLCKECE